MRLDGLRRDSEAGRRSPCTCIRARCAGAPPARAASAGRAPGPPGRAGSRSANASSTKPARRGEKTASPSLHAAHSVGQLGAGDRLGHVAARAGADHRDHVLGRVADRQREEANLPGGLRPRAGSPQPRRRPACGRRPERRRARAPRSPARPPRRRRSPPTTSIPSPSLSRTPARKRAWSSTIRTRGGGRAAHGVPPRSTVISTSVPRPARSAPPPGRRRAACDR